MLLLTVFNLHFLESDLPDRGTDYDTAIIAVINNGDLPSNIDMQKVRESWLLWNNDARLALGLNEYVYNDELNKSATMWSEVSKSRGYMDHKREGQTEYYDFYKIRDWFKNEAGLEFENDLFTENIAWGNYNCDESNPDCTQYLIDSIKYSFDYFMAEKGEDYSPHYDSVVNKYFKIIGLGIAIDKEAHKYFLTVHYAGEIKPQ